MTRRGLVLLAAGGSAALLLGAWAFQLAGYPPCKLCIWQRWPHGVAIAAGALALWTGWRVWVALGGVAALTTAGVGVYHAGVERGWWEGPTTCTAADIGGLTPEQLMEQIMAAPLVRCDDVVWSFLGISMAGWNALLSLALAAVWTLALARRAPQPAAHGW